MRFAADSMLGRLARWLRLLGYDTIYRSAWKDNDLIRCSIVDARIILSRDRKLLSRIPQARGVLLHSGRLLEQLKEMRIKLGLKAGAGLTRCSLCNIPVVEVCKDEVRDRVPPYVYETQEEFKLCACCGRVYWLGTHWKDIVEELAAAGLLPER